MSNGSISPETLILDARVANAIESNQDAEPSFPVHYIRLDLHEKMLAESQSNVRPTEMIVDFEVNGMGQIYGLSDRGRMFILTEDVGWDLYASPLKGGKLP